MARRPFFSAARRESAGAVPAYKSFLHRTRFLLLFLIFVFNFCIWTNSILIDFMILAMEVRENLEVANLNYSEIYRIQDEIRNDLRSKYFTFSQLQKSVLFSASSLGAVLAIYPAWCLITKFGYRRIATFSGILSSFFISFVPWFAYFGYISLTVSHFIQGSCLAAPILLIPSVIRKWSTRKNEHLTFIVLFCFIQVPPILLFPIYSYLSLTFIGWPIAFYLQSIFTFLVTTLFFYFYKETPIRHAHVSDAELSKIQRCQSMRGKLSYEKILRCSQFQSVTLSIFVYFLILQIFIQKFSIFVQTSNIVEISWMLCIFMLLHVIAKLLIFRVMKTPTKHEIELLTIISFVVTGVAMISIVSFKLSDWLKLAIFSLISVSLGITPIFRAAHIIAGKYYLAVMIRTHIFTFFLAGCFTPITLALGRFIWFLLTALLAASHLFFVIQFRYEASDWEVRNEAKIEERIAPVSHPRPCEFTTSFDDSIVVSIVSRGLDRCDTCKKHGFQSKHHQSQIPTRKIFDTIIEEENTTHM
ncbi:unnamed protein product [Caenorhabditis angaria]|uniref:Major facilitator superfamily (MFS) profile domain-containing protein n=1 Tax=Caenorhabditis angaria TaxID=860376 RepID=A0A9P1IPI6_9PELO|nr:unnamed protein product [Caenorhabditis angaria]